MAELVKKVKNIGEFQKKYGSFAALKKALPDMELAAALKVGKFMESKQKAMEDIYHERVQAVPQLSKLRNQMGPLVKKLQVYQGLKARMRKVEEDLVKKTKELAKMEKEAGDKGKTSKEAKDELKKLHKTADYKNLKREITAAQKTKDTLDKQTVERDKLEAKYAVANKAYDQMRRKLYDSFGMSLVQNGNVCVVYIGTKPEFAVKMQ